MKEFNLNYTVVAEININVTVLANNEDEAIAKGNNLVSDNYMDDYDYSDIRSIELEHIDYDEDE